MEYDEDGVGVAVRVIVCLCYCVYGAWMPSATTTTMPASVVCSSPESRAVTVESETMARDEAATALPAPSSTCQVNEPQLSQQVQNGNGMILKGKLETDKDESTEQTNDSATVSWQDRLKMQENLIQVLKQEKEKQLLDIASHLMVMEAELRKEQNKIMDLLQEKDQTIALQEKQIQALLILNRKLSAKMDRHRNCSHCKQNMAESSKSRHHFSDPTEMLRQILRSNRSTCRSASDVSADRNEENKHHFAKNIICKLALDKKKVHFKPHAYNKTDDRLHENDPVQTPSESSAGTSDVERNNSFSSNPEWSHLYAIEEVVKSYDQESDSDLSSFPLQNFSHLQTLEELDESEEINYVHVNEADEREPFLLGNYEEGGEKSSQLSVCYNRVMSNHRNVTKPKDVKYKKINRVKSRSLEELRGKLRNWTPPFFLSEKST